MEAIEKQFALHEQTRDGYTVKVFKDNYACLAEVLECLNTYQDRDFLVHDGARLTFGDCGQQAARLATHLRETHGVGPGDRIAIVLPNSPEWIVSFLAIASLGAVPALVNGRASATELEYCVTSTHCALAIHDRQSDIGVPGLPKDSITAICAQAVTPDLPRVSRAPDDEALLMFTSGTTGFPKAAALTHQGLLTALKTIQYSSALIANEMAQAYGIDYETLVQMRPPPVTLLMFPLFHVSGCHAVFLTNLLAGGKLVLMSRWDPKQALELIQAEKITSFPGSPTMQRDLLNLPEHDEYDLSSLTNLSVGGQATSPTLLTELHTAHPTAVMGTGYGMTECNGTLTLIVGEQFMHNPKSVGRVVDTYDAQIRDDDGQVLGALQPGEIHVRGAALMSGYANVETSPFDANGWFATGDIGQFDEAGLLYIVDRKTDMVISGGENIYCAEVERVLDMHEHIEECATFGVPDERLGEKLVAHIVLTADSQLTSEAVAAHCAEHLAKHKVPREIHFRDKPFPYNASGKIIKRTLRDEYAS